MEQGSRWDGSGRASTYDGAWAKMEARGENPHGEADFVERFEPTSVLDAGCGTGRVAIELSRRNVSVVGTDLDAAMLAQARNKAPEISWVEANLAELELNRTFDVVVMAGNIVLFVAPGTEAAVVAGAGRHVAAGGHLVAGFSLGRGVSPEDWEAWLTLAGLEPLQRFASWQGEPWSATADYLVSVSRRP